MDEGGGEQGRGVGIRLQSATPPLGVTKTSQRRITDIEICLEPKKSLNKDVTGLKLNKNRPYSEMS